MRNKIMGVTVGTPTSPNKIKDEIKPVQTVNGVKPDENGNVDVAPAGYGLGERNGRIAKDANDAVENGWWWGGGLDAVNYPEDAYKVSPMFVATTEYVIFQTIYWAGNVVSRVGNRAGNLISWSEWAYDNPPLTAGEEFRTTERIDDWYIYKKADEYGNVYYRLECETEWRKYTNGAGGGGSENAVQYIEQNLTEEQKAQVLANLGLKKDQWTLTYEDGTTETKVVYVG